MAVFTVSISDGTTLSNLAVSAGRGPKGDGFTGGTYDAGTGKVTFTSNDGIGFSTDDLRGDLTEPGPIGSVTPSTGAFTSLSTTGNAVIGGDLTVEGTTTTVDSTTVAVGDKNVELAKDATTAAEADGGGITLNGASATITYSSANDYWALNKGLNVSGNVSLSGTVDGRDVAADGSKLDGIESGATADQTAGEIKTSYESNADTNAFTDSEKTKLSNIETNADVTDTANVTAAGALMDSELASEASVKALDQGVATTDSPDFAGLSVDTDTLFVDASTNQVGIGTSSPQERLDVVGGDIRVSDTFPVIALEENDVSDSRHTFLSSGGNLFINCDGNSLGNKSIIFRNGGSTEAARIDSSGNVGIGTSSPQDNLHVAGDLGSLSLERTGSSFDGTFRLLAGGLTGGGFRIIDDTLGTNLERMRIDSSGNLLVGTTTSAPGVGNTDPGARIGASGCSISRDGTNTPLFLNQNQDGQILRFYRSGSQVGSVSVTSSSTSYNTSSDERLKENIADAQPASDLIDGIQVREFDWKVDGEHQRYGMVAQELETVAPEAVTKGETEDDMWSVDYSKLVPMLVKEIQDLRKRVNELENTQ